MRAVLLVSLICTLSACLKLTPTLPEWVSNKPQDKQSFYAIGQGVNLYNAEINARASLAAELSATVSDLTKIYSVDDGKFQRQVYEQYTSVEVSKVNISNARVIRQEKSGHSYFVLLEMNKQDLAGQLRAELEHLVRPIERLLKSDHDDSFERWWTLRSLLPKVKHLARNIDLLTRIERLTYQKESKLVSDFFEQFDTSYAHRALEIKNQTKIDKLQALVSKQLQDESIVLAESSFWSRQDHIEISSEYASERIGQEYYVDGVLWLRLKAASGQILSEFSLSGRGVSYGGQRQSRAIVDQQLYDKLGRSRIFERLLDE